MTGKINFKQFLLTMFIAASFAACKKSGGAAGGDAPAPGDMLLSNTGWEKVATIPYQKSTLGIQGFNAMKAYDLTKVGNDIAILYSEDYRFQTNLSSNYFKVKYTPGQGLGKPVAASFTYVQTGSEATQCLRFVPGTYNAFNTIFATPNYYWQADVYHDGNTHPAAQNLGLLNQVFNARWAANGSLFMGQIVPNFNGSTTWHYTYPASGNFTVINNQWRNDPTTWLATAPVQLADGTFNDFVLSKKGAEYYFSIIKNTSATPPVTDGANFQTIVRSVIPDLEAQAIISTESTDDQFTILLGTFGRNAANDVTLSKLAAYRWKKSTNIFEKLYSNVSVSPELYRALVVPDPAGDIPGPLGPYRANPVRFLPDGTAYLLYEYVNPSNSDDRYTAVATINAKGSQILGKYAKSAFQNNFYFQFGITACRYLNGAFYAVVAPKNEQVYGYDDAHFRAELIKLNY